METLSSYLQNWDVRNRETHRSIALFDPKLTATWSSEQKISFVKLFYHARGHFHDFLWYMGNFAPDHKQRQKVLANIAEEFGSARSHEQLYFAFAQAIGADLSREVVDEESYLPFIREFNKGHLDYIHTHDWDSRLCAFAAYERLDNVDYEDLYILAKTICADESALTFFKVHAFVRHFDMADQGDLQRIWDTSPEKVKDAFEFISNHQTNMWEKLSETI